MKVGRIESKYIDESLRLNADFHLAEGVIYDRFLRTKVHKKLGELASEIFCAGRSKRIYVNKLKGIPYLGNTDILSLTPLIGCNYTSKAFWKEKKSFLKEGMILTGRVGQNTVGTYSYTSADLEGCIGSDNVIRIVSNGIVKNGYLFSFLASKYGYHISRRHISGNAQPFITEDMLSNIPVPILKPWLEDECHDLIIDAANLRIEANKILSIAQKDLKEIANLPDLVSSEYDYFGTNNCDKNATVFSRNISEIKTVSINAFNYSKKIEILEKRVKREKYKYLTDCLDDNQFFSTGSFKRLELNSSKGIKLINQSDIFNAKKKGKFVSRAFVKTDNLAEYGEVLIAGVGTLGEGETFCRTIFVNEELQGQLLAGEFIRMKTNSSVPSGYLYCWLSSDYGFRLIRKTQTGTKLCRPIQDLLKELPVPLLSDNQMKKIDNDVKKAHTLLYEAYCKENRAIELVEKEIESWQK